MTEILHSLLEIIENYLNDINWNWKILKIDINNLYLTTEN